MRRIAAGFFWLLLLLAGAWAYATLTLSHGEPVSSAYILTAALCTYAIGYRFYSKWIAARVLMLNDRRATPCQVHDDGKDFVKTNKWIVFGHHFAAISGPGPLVGPVLAAQFGYLPGTLWILIGVVVGGAIQDMVILFASLRRDGKSLGQMIKEELNSTAGAIALIAILAIMIILLAVLALVVIKALAHSPWGIFTVSATIPIAMLMGCYLRFGRIGKVMEASLFGIVALLLAVWGGKLIHQSPEWAAVFGLQEITLAWAIIIYGFAASVLPVWLLLAPRDYLSTFMKLGTIMALALGIFLVLPNLRMPALTRFVDGSGLVVAGKIFPFCFITIACGAISGFHTLIASGTTPKILTRESYVRPVGYGAMCLESLVAIMALIAACTLEPGVYLSMNVKGEPAVTVAKVTALGFPVTTQEMDALAGQIGENSLFGRTGGAATLAVGMAQIFSNAVKGRWLDLWYHFAIMFEALFILTTIDAGTRVGRYLLQDVLGQIWKPLGDTRAIKANLVASSLIVASWGYFLIQGVRDPYGGINSLWPLFGIANQMLAAIALCLSSTILLKMQLAKTDPTGRPSIYSGRPSLALITFVPLVWLLAVTFSAGIQKITHSDPRIGFLSQAHQLTQEQPGLRQAIASAQAKGDTDGLKAAESKLKINQTVRFNNQLDAGVAAAFLLMVGSIVILSVREWVLLLQGRRPATLHESPAIDLPEYAVAEGKPIRGFAALGLTLVLAKELTTEGQTERARNEVILCECDRLRPGGDISSATTLRSAQVRAYLESTDRRYNGVTRCC